MLHPLVPRFTPQPFVVPQLLRTAHAMTIFAALYQRDFDLPDGKRREFQTELDTTIVAYCHWQTDRLSHPTIIQVHGLEGDADRHYMLGTATKAWRAGFNVVRMNVRNCGGTEHLTPTLYHSGLTADVRGVLFELIEKDQLQHIFLIGFSMGANQSLKLAGELGEAAPPQLKGIAAISPPIDLELCSIAIREKQNIIYERRFLNSLRAKLHLKAQTFPDLCDLERLDRIKDLWEFDDVITGPKFGFGDARGYYAAASSQTFIPKIKIPTLIIQAQDDPFIPFTPFAALPENKYVAILANKYGGHVGFWQHAKTRDGHYWAEQTAVDFCTATGAQASRLPRARPTPLADVASRECD